MSAQFFPRLAHIATVLTLLLLTLSCGKGKSNSPASPEPPRESQRWEVVEHEPTVMELEGTVVTLEADKLPPGTVLDLISITDESFNTYLFEDEFIEGEAFSIEISQIDEIPEGLAFLIERIGYAGEEDFLNFDIVTILPAACDESGTTPPATIYEPGWDCWNPSFGWAKVDSNKIACWVPFRDAAIYLVADVNAWVLSNRAGTSYGPNVPDLRKIEALHLQGDECPAKVNVIEIHGFDQPNDTFVFNPGSEHLSHANHYRALNQYYPAVNPASGLCVQSSEPQDYASWFYFYDTFDAPLFGAKGSGRKLADLIHEKILSKRPDAAIILHGSSQGPLVGLIAYDWLTRIDGYNYPPEILTQLISVNGFMTGSEVVSVLYEQGWKLWHKGDAPVTLLAATIGIKCTAEIEKRSMYQFKVLPTGSQDPPLVADNYNIDLKEVWDRLEPIVRPRLTVWGSWLNMNVAGANPYTLWHINEREHNLYQANYSIFSMITEVSSSGGVSFGPTPLTFGHSFPLTDGCASFLSQQAINLNTMTMLPTLPLKAHDLDHTDWTQKSGGAFPPCSFQFGFQGSMIDLISGGGSQSGYQGQWNGMKQFIEAVPCVCGNPPEPGKQCPPPLLDCCSPSPVDPINFTGVPKHAWTVLHDASTYDVCLPTGETEPVVIAAAAPTEPGVSGRLFFSQQEAGDPSHWHSMALPRDDSTESDAATPRVIKSGGRWYVVANVGVGDQTARSLLVWSSGSATPRVSADWLQSPTGPFTICLNDLPGLEQTQAAIPAPSTKLGLDTDGDKLYIAAAVADEIGGSLGFGRTVLFTSTVAAPTSLAGWTWEQAGEILPGIAEGQAVDLAIFQAQPILVLTRLDELPYQYQITTLVKASTGVWETDNGVKIYSPATMPPVPEVAIASGFAFLAYAVDSKGEYDSGFVSVWKADLNEFSSGSDWTWKRNLQLWPPASPRVFMGDDVSLVSSDKADGFIALAFRRADEEGIGWYSEKYVLLTACDGPATLWGSSYYRITPEGRGTLTSGLGLEFLNSQELLFTWGEDLSPALAYTSCAASIAIH